MAAHQIPPRAETAWRQGPRVLPNIQANLLAQVEGADQVIASAIEVPCESWGIDPEIWMHDYQSLIQSLPATLGTTLQTLPASVPYLKADDETIERWRPVVESIPGFRVGIYWQGSIEHANDKNRSFRLAEFAPLAAVPGVTLVSLQKNHGAEQVSGATFPVHELGDDYAASDDWLDTAAVVAISTWSWDAIRRSVTLAARWGSPSG